MKLILVAIIIVALADEGISDRSKIDPRLLSRKSSETSNIFITFHNGTEYTIEHTGKSLFPGRAEKITALHDRLREHANHSQINVIAYLQRREKGPETKFQSFWISNEVFVKDVTMDDITALAKLQEVKFVSLEKVILLDTIDSGNITLTTFPGVQWGVTKIKAPEAINLLKTSSVIASQVVVGVIDTGCRYTHETLRYNWVGEYGWFDPYDGNMLPFDLNGHGTHVVSSC